jgi:hypothetical protein
MDQGEFFKVLDELDDAFFIWNGALRTRARPNKESVDPIVAVAQYLGYKGKDLTEAVRYLKLDLTFAIRIIKIVDGEGAYNPSDLKLQAKIMNRTVNKH